jgi:hypothetical protein
MATVKETEKAVQSIAFDLLWGVAAIAEELGLNQHQVIYRINTGELPVRRYGRRVYASRTELHDHFFGPNSAA